MANRTGTVLSEGLSLRASPNGEVIDELAKGDLFEIISATNPGALEWLSVRVIQARGVSQVGRSGYVASHDVKGVRLVKIDEEVPRPQPTPQPGPYSPPRPPVTLPAPAHGNSQLVGWIMGGVAAAGVFVYWLLSR